MVFPKQKDWMNENASRFISAVLMFVMILLVMVLCIGIAPAQVTSGQISGIVTDASGAPLPSVTVGIVSDQTTIERTAVTDDDGFYLITNLPPGGYRVRVEQQGFKVYTEDNIQLTAGNRLSINPSLQVGELSETVTVVAQGEQVQQDSGSVGQLIDGSQVRELSLNGRNLMTLLMVVPGVAVTTDEFDRGGMTFGSIGSFNVNGLRRRLIIA